MTTRINACLTGALGHHAYLHGDEEMVRPTSRTRRSSRSANTHPSSPSPSNPAALKDLCHAIHDRHVSHAGDTVDPDAIDTAAGELRGVGTKVSTQGGTVLTSWQKISGSYDAPEENTLFHAMNPVKTAAEVRHRHRFGGDRAGGLRRRGTHDQGGGSRSGPRRPRSSPMSPTGWRRRRPRGPASPPGRSSGTRTSPASTPTTT